MQATDFLNSINQTKKNLIRESDSPKAAEKIYNSFFTTRCLSYHSDCIFLVNELNTRGLREFGLSNLMHYEFLLHVLEPRKRFSKWGKSKKEDRVELIKQVYKYSTQKAKEVQDLFSDEDIKKMKKNLETGGSGKG